MSTNKATLPEAVRLEQFIEQEVQSHQWATFSALDRIRRSLLRVAEAAAQQERACLEELLAELRNIADAKPSTWHEETRDQFQEWAQNRARAALAKVASHPPPTPEDR